MERCPASSDEGDWVCKVSATCTTSSKELAVNQSEGSVGTPSHRGLYFLSRNQMPVTAVKPGAFSLICIPANDYSLTRAILRRWLYFLSLAYSLKILADFREVFTFRGAGASGCSWVGLVIVLTCWLLPTEGCSQQAFHLNSWVANILFRQIRYRNIWTFHNLSF